MFDSYVGIPYRPLGYSRKGASCYGLCYLVLKEKFGIVIEKHNKLVLAAFRNNEATDINAFTKGWSVLKDWRAMKAGDVLRMRGYFEDVDGNEVLTNQHVGIYIGNNRVLHTEKATGSIVEKTNSKRFAWRPIKAYTWND